SLNEIVAHRLLLLSYLGHNTNLIASGGAVKGCTTTSGVRGGSYYEIHGTDRATPPIEFVLIREIRGDFPSQPRSITTGHRIAIAQCHLTIVISRSQQQGARRGK